MIIVGESRHGQDYSLQSVACDATLCFPDAQPVVGIVLYACA